VTVARRLVAVVRAAVKANVEAGYILEYDMQSRTAPVSGTRTTVGLSVP